MSEDKLVVAQLRRIEILEERNRQLEELLIPSNVPFRPEWGLTATEQRIFAHLTTKDMSSKPSIAAAIYADRIDEQPDIKIVDVMVCKMRKKLDRFGVEIQTIWGHGYALVDRQKYVTKRGGE